MKIHKIVSLAFFSIFLHKNLQIDGKNIEELENWVRIVKGHLCQFWTKYGGKGTDFLSPEIKMI